ncbi:Cytochrome c [Desulfovibrionales bacterium]
MYNNKYIIPGLAIFLALITSPFWLNLAKVSYTKPNIKLPSDQKECIETKETMRSEHMRILNLWRDKVLRDGQRVYVASTGKKWNMSLQNTCMKCHINKVEFCDKCHNTASVSPYCWTCHIEPKGNQ